MAAGTSLVYLLIISYVSLEDPGNAFYFIPFEYNSLVPYSLYSQQLAQAQELELKQKPAIFIFSLVGTLSAIIVR